MVPKFKHWINGESEGEYGKEIQRRSPVENLGWAGGPHEALRMVGLELSWGGVQGKS